MNTLKEEPTSNQKLHIIIVAGKSNGNYWCLSAIYERSSAWAVLARALRSILYAKTAAKRGSDALSLSPQSSSSVVPPPAPKQSMFVRSA